MVDFHYCDGRGEGFLIIGGILNSFSNIVIIFGIIHFKINLWKKRMNDAYQLEFKSRSIDKNITKLDAISGYKSLLLYNSYHRK